MPLDAMKSVYDALSKHYTMPDYNTFTTGMQDTSRQRTVYNTLSQHYTMPVYEEFTGRLSGTVTPAPTTAVEQPAIEQPTAPTPMAGPGSGGGLIQLPPAQQLLGALPDIGAGAVKEGAKVLRMADMGRQLIQSIPNGMNSVGDYIADKYGVPADKKGYILEELAKQFDIAATNIEQYGLPPGLAKEIYQGVGGALPAIATIAGSGMKRGALTLYGGAGAAEESINRGDSIEDVIKNTAMGLATSAANEYIFHGLAKLKVPLTGRVLTSGTVGAMPGIVAGNAEQAASGFITMSILSIPGPKTTWSDFFRENRGTTSRAPYTPEERQTYDTFMTKLKEERPEIYAEVEKLNVLHKREAVRVLYNEALQRHDTNVEAFNRINAIIDNLGIDLRFITVDEMKKRVAQRITRGVAGRFNRAGNFIEAAPDPIFVGHELGHKIIDLNKSTDPAIAGINLTTMDTKELNAVRLNFKSYYESTQGKLLGLELSRNQNNYEEGMADFISLYLNDPMKAKQLAPKTFDIWKERLDKMAEVGEPTMTLDQVMEKWVGEVAPPKETMPVGDGTVTEPPRPTVSEVAPVSTESGTVKEPWQMTQKEWVGEGNIEETAVGNTIIKNVNSPHFTGEDAPQQAEAWAKSRGLKEGDYNINTSRIHSTGEVTGASISIHTQGMDARSQRKRGAFPVHEAIVKQALSEGKPVPIEVLSEYQDLVKRPNSTESDVEAAQAVVNKTASVSTKPETQPNVEYFAGQSTLNNRIFGIAKSRGISHEAVFGAIKEITGIENPVFKGEGPDVIREPMVKELFDRMHRVKRDWTDSEKRAFLKTGERPLPDLEAEVTRRQMQSGGVGDIFRSIQSKIGASNNAMLHKMGAIGREIERRFGDHDAYKIQKIAQAQRDVRAAFRSLSRDEIGQVIRAANSGEQSNIDALPEKLRSSWELISKHRQIVDFLAKQMKMKTYTVDGKSRLYTGMGPVSFPHVFEFDALRNTKKRAAFITNIMKKGKVSYADAVGILDKLIESRTQTRAGNLEYSRELDAPGWIGDPDSPGFSKKRAINALDRYFVQAYGRLADARFYDSYGSNLVGKDYKSLSDLVNSETDPAKRVMMTRIVRSIRGLNIPDVERPLLSAFRNLNVVKLLGMAGIPNMWQTTVSLPAKAFTFGFQRGVKIYARGWAQAIRNPSFARYEVGSAAMQTVREAVGISGRGVTRKMAEGAMKIYGMKPEEAVNNIVAASMGKPFIKEAMAIANGSEPSRLFGIKVRKMASGRLRRLATEELRRYGVSEESIKAGKLTDVDITRASWQLAMETQFGGGPQYFPLWYNNEYGKVAFQFKKFNFAMTRLMKDDVLKPALHGNFAPLVTTMTSAIIAGEAINQIKQVLLKQVDRPESTLKRILEDVTAAGVLGVFMDYANSAIMGNVLGTIVGPTVSGAAEFTEYLARGNVREAIRRQIPIIRSTKIGKENKQEYE